MGTRAFSSQFLNKSFDNIHDTSFEIGRFNPIGSCTDINQADNSSFTNRAKTTLDDFFLRDVDEEDEDVSSIKSTSADSEFLIAKGSNELLLKSPQLDACVIRKFFLHVFVH